MQQKKVLILTDHKNHSAENSLYELALQMLLHEQTLSVDIASRVTANNSKFFDYMDNTLLFATAIDESFAFRAEDHPLSKNFREVDISTYDLVWLRLPPPLSEAALNFYGKVFSEAIVINEPRSIHETGSKEFLINFPSVSPPMKICRYLEDIMAFKDLFPIVLKPFNEYGGKGILKIKDGVVSSGNQNISFEIFSDNYQQKPIDYLAVKYLKNVDQGDKRIVVVNGEILGASLRLPAEDSWLCNVAMGGTSHIAKVETREEEIIRLINPTLSEKGIVMYGVDTLVGDDGQRVLSEINTTSIGGLPQIAKMNNLPLVEKAIDLIWAYYNDKMNENG